MYPPTTRTKHLMAYVYSFEYISIMHVALNSFKAGSALPACTAHYKKGLVFHEGSAKRPSVGLSIVRKLRYQTILILYQA